MSLRKYLSADSLIKIIQHSIYQEPFLHRNRPYLKVLIVEDSLASNFPHLPLLDSLNMQYTIGVEPGAATIIGVPESRLPLIGSHYVIA